MKVKIVVFLVIIMTLVLATGAGAVFPDSWVQSNTSGFGDSDNYAVTSLAVFDEGLWAGTANESGGAQLHKLAAGSWSPVITDGFTNTNNILISDLVTFKSKLYAGTRNPDDGGQILRSADGTAWESVTPAALDPSNGDVVVFDTFQGKIYAGTWSYTDTHGAEIWRSNNGNSGDWAQVVADGFDGDVNNEKIVSIQEYKGVLFAGTDNTITGAEVWSTSDGETWNQVNDDGFGDPYNWSVTLQEFAGYFYAGTYNYAGSDNPGAELWRCELCDGSDWGQVPIAKGFGDTENRAIRSLEIYNNVLYAVTYNASTGMEVWASSDGTNWAQANLDGFGDSANRFPNWDNSVENFQDHLYVGTWNTTDGGEVWRYYETTIYLPIIMK